MALVEQSGCHRAPTRMAAAASDASVSIQLGHMRLKRVTGRVVHLLSCVVCSTLAVHAVLVTLERQHELAVGPKAPVSLRIVAHSPAPLNPKRQVCIERGYQVTIRRIHAALAASLGDDSPEGHFGANSTRGEKEVPNLDLGYLTDAQAGVNAQQQNENVAFWIAADRIGDTEKVPVLARL